MVEAHQLVPIVTEFMINEYMKHHWNNAKQQSEELQNIPSRTSTTKKSSTRCNDLSQCSIRYSLVYRINHLRDIFVTLVATNLIPIDPTTTKLQHCPALLSQIQTFVINSRESTQMKHFNNPYQLCESVRYSRRAAQSFKRNSSLKAILQKQIKEQPTNTAFDTYSLDNSFSAMKAVVKCRNWSRTQRAVEHFTAFPFS